MSVLWILLVGVVIVIGGILLFRLHAFLVLILAAFVVSALTPDHALVQFGVDRADLKVLDVDTARETFLVRADRDAVPLGARLLVLEADKASGEFAEVATLEVASYEKPEDSLGDAYAVATVVSARNDWTWSEDQSVIHPRDLLAARDLADQTIGERVAAAFGSTCAKIGILIAMAAIIGKCLLDSGAADRIVRSALRLFGERAAPGAFLSSGFLLGIPVFFDTVFYLMIPLGKALRMRTGKNYLLYVLTIVAGATMAHSLVPPTPGPLFVAEELGVDLGLMIMAGCIVGIFSSGTGYLFARWINSRTELPLRESADLALKDLEELTRRGDEDLPPLGVAMLPILLPVVLIAGYTILKGYSEHFLPAFMQVAETLGNKNIALVIAAAVALIMLAWQKRTSRHELARSVQAALASGGVIILITAGGGAFGRAMQQTGVASLIDDLPQGSIFITLLLAFLITATVRTAQGSATVAMITAVGILAGLASSETLGFHPVYLALAIGCGSKPLAWMNDSGFWVICQMSGMTEAEGLKFITPMSAAMAVVGLGVTLLGAWLLPMAG